MKKLIATLLLCAFACALISSCANNPKVSSSTTAKPEENSSTITTTSKIVSDTDTESKKPSDNSSKKENNTSKKPPSSVISATRPGNSSESESVKVPVSDRMDVVMCGFAPTTCDYYGTDRESALREMEDVVAMGYVNALSLNAVHMRQADIWELAVKYDLSIWCSAWDLYKSSDKTLEEYMVGIQKTIDFAKQNKEWYSHFKGFWFDEKVWRGETNEDFIAETKYIYQKYGKRTYAVLATGEFSPIEGNAGAGGGAVSDTKWVRPESFQYITDVGFDSYGVDVRDGAPPDRLIAQYKDIMPGIVDGKSYYREYTKKLLGMIDHPVNLWYLPCAYTRNILGGLGGINKADEGYCLGHLEFFYEELKKQKYAGGLMLYVYSLSKEGEASGTRGLQYHFSVPSDSFEDEDNLYKIYPETRKWLDYSDRLREIVEEYNYKKVKFVTNP